MNTVDRSARIRVLVAEHAARRSARVSVVDVCTAAVAALPVQGAGVSAMSPNTAGYPLCSTDDVSEQLEELQLTLGEGPCVDAFARGAAALAGDLLAGEALDRWPVFAPAATRVGAGAVFAFPLRVGPVSPGVLDLYAHHSGDLDPEHLADALVFADTAALVLLGTPLAEAGAPAEHAADGSPDGHPAELGGYRAEIGQATGMLTEQLGVGVDEAFVRLRAHAYAHERRLADVTRDVVARTLRFSPDPGPNEETTDDDT
ncbi:ANTAR domain-containing protein [Streptomycetaceae bacterium NBC_01309]